MLVLEVRPIWRLETARDTQSGLTNVRRVKETWSRRISKDYFRLRNSGWVAGRATYFCGEVEWVVCGGRDSFQRKQGDSCPFSLVQSHVLNPQVPLIWVESVHLTRARGDGKASENRGWVWLTKLVRVPQHSISDFCLCESILQADHPSLVLFPLSFHRKEEPL